LKEQAALPSLYLIPSYRRSLVDIETYPSAIKNLEFPYQTTTRYHLISHLWRIEALQTVTYPNRFSSRIINVPDNHWQTLAFFVLHKTSASLNS
jgi:hypothetical protein